MNKPIESYVCELICTALAGLQQSGKIQEQDVQSLHYTAKGAEATLEYLGQIYKLTVEPRR